MRMIQMALTFLFLLGLQWLPSSEAMIFKKKPKTLTPEEQVRTYQPPPASTMGDYCEPYRHKALLLNQAPLWQKPFVIFPKNWAIYQHRHCVDNLMMQEREYLKHTDIPQAPSLPKLKTEEKPSVPSIKQEPAHANRP